MARNEVIVRISRPNWDAEDITVVADPKNPTEIREAVRQHLLGRNWDEQLLPEFTARWLGSITPHEVQVG